MKADLPEPGRPSDVAFTTTLADAGTVSSCRHSTAVQTLDVSAFTRSAISAALARLAIGDPELSSSCKRELDRYGACRASSAENEDALPRRFDESAQ